MKGKEKCCGDGGRRYGLRSELVVVVIRRTAGGDDHKRSAEDVGYEDFDCIQGHR